MYYGRETGSTLGLGNEVLPAFDIENPSALVVFSRVSALMLVGESRLLKQQLFLAAAVVRWFGTDKIKMRCHGLSSLALPTARQAECRAASASPLCRFSCSALRLPGVTASVPQFGRTLISFNGLAQNSAAAGLVQLSTPWAQCFPMSYVTFWYVVFE